MSKSLLLKFQCLFAALMCVSCGIYHDKSNDQLPENQQAILSAPIGFAQVNRYVFGPSCASCHSSANPSAGVSLDTYSSAKAHLTRIVQRSITTRDMPPPATSPLNSFQISLLSRWIDAGAPEQGIAGNPQGPNREALVLDKIRADFDHFVKPLVKKACMDCHDSNARPTGLGRLPIVRRVQWRHIIEGSHALDFSKKFPNWSEQSAEPMYYLSAIKSVVAAGTMPPKSYRLFHLRDGKVLGTAENEVILNWIQNSTDLLASVSAFPLTAKQYLNTRCLSCHNDSIQSGGYRLGDTGNASNGIPYVTPFEPENSALFLVLLNNAAERKGLPEMPLGSSANEQEQRLIYDWIKQGASP